MVVIEVKPGTAFGIVPANLLQQGALPMKWQQHSFVTRSGEPVAVPYGERGHADDQRGSTYSEFLKAILLLTFLFSMLILAVIIGGRF